MVLKARTKLAVIGISLLSGTAHAVYQDIAVNGGFETGDFTGWTLFPGSLGVAGQQITSANPSAGTYSARLTEPDAAANIIKQANLLPGGWFEGQQVDIQFDIRGTALAGGVFFAEAFSELSGGGVSKSEILGGGPLFPDPDPDVWTTYMFSTTIGPDSSGGFTLQLNSTCGTAPDCLADYFVDNVSIKADVNVIPVPAAVWLFGSGLIGLVGLARRKKAV